MLMWRSHHPPVIRANFVAAIVAELSRRRLPFQDLLRTHLGSDRLGSLYDEIPLTRYLALFEAAARLAGDSALGARAGLRMRPEELGPLGVTFMAAPDVGTALDRLRVFLRAWQGGTTVELEIGSDVAEWIYQIQDPAIGPRRQDAEFSIAVTCSLVRAMLGKAWAPLEIHFEHSVGSLPEQSSATIQRLLGAPVQFEQPLNRLIIDRADLGRLVSLPQQPIAPYLEQHLRDLLPFDEERGFAAQVTFLVARRMGHRPLSMGSLANELGVSTRTLQRRLAEEGTTLRAVIQSERARLAEALLESKRKPIGSIAHELGYADPAIFSRAFRSWHGGNPRSFRRAACG